MAKKRIWLLALAAVALLAALAALFALSGAEENVYKGAKLVLYQDAFLRMPGGTA